MVADPGQGTPVVLLPDPRARRPGRGAWLHPDPGCLDLAERRRAFARALRVQAPVDVGGVRSYLAQHQHVPEHQPSSSEAGQQPMGTR
ncbi:MAG: DUF448 domain-containing protein [Actinomycetes bacterium]